MKLNAVTPALLSLVLGLAAGPGCQTVNTAERADSRSVANFIKDKRITTDDSLANAAGVNRINEAIVAGNLLKIQAELYNGTSSRKEINYRFDWIDSAGMVMRTNLSNWEAISLAGKESVYVTAVAPSPDAVDFRLKLIEPTKK